MGMRSAIRLGIGLLLAVSLAVSLAGCAQQPGTRSAARQARASGPDFARDGAANGAASQLGQRLLGDLPALPGYAGLQIVSYGIEVDVVGEPDAAIRAAVDRDTERYQGSPIPVRYRKVLNTEQDLKALSDRISADRDEWLKDGIQLSSWGIDITTNTVRVTLSHYTDGYRDALVAAYGNRITVTPEGAN